MANTYGEEKMKDITELIRAIPRPFLTVFIPVSWVIFLFGVYESGGTITDVPAIYTTLAVSIIGVHFPLRSWEKTKK